MVEHNLAKVGAASSILVSRSRFEIKFFNTDFNVLRSPGGGMVDTRDLKSLEHCVRAGSSPASGTNFWCGDIAKW